MGRLGPLTSMALGRSPYDDVVRGEGEDDPHEPQHQYDDKGRLMNPESRKIVGEIIRAHNEVMQVIGVAEPENNGINEQRLDLARRHQMHENTVGRRLLRAGRALGIFGVWGIGGVRRRILLYKQYAHIPFTDLLSYEHRRKSYVELCLAGTPTLIPLVALRWSLPREMFGGVWDSLIQGAASYVWMHLEMFLLLQRLDLVPSRQLFPTLSFFVPFSSSSPLAAPPLPMSFDRSAIGLWLVQLAYNIAPVVAFWGLSDLLERAKNLLWDQVYSRLPKPARNKRFITVPPPSAPPQWPATVPESPTLGAADREIRHVTTVEQDVPTLRALEGQTPTDPIPVSALRRQSTFSSRGAEDYGTDDEDAEMVNPTLISFDVDTSEPAQDYTTSAVWSAELRPSFGQDGPSQPKDEPVYIVNALTSLPAIFAADIITGFFTSLLFAPPFTAALRYMARSYAYHRGIPLEGMYRTDLRDNFTWQVIANVTGLVITQFWVETEIWAAVTGVSQWMHLSEEEWREKHEKDQAQDPQSEMASEEVPWLVDDSQAV